jgi:hypothetical protein
VPHFLSQENKRKRLNFAKRMLNNTRKFIQKSGIIEIDHPPYSPDLAQCDYWLFDYLKKYLEGQVDQTSLVMPITKLLKKIPKEK